MEARLWASRGKELWRRAPGTVPLRSLRPWQPWLLLRIPFLRHIWEEEHAPLTQVGTTGSSFQVCRTEVIQTSASSPWSKHMQIKGHLYTDVLSQMTSHLLWVCITPILGLSSNPNYFPPAASGMYASTSPLDYKLCKEWRLRFICLCFWPTFSWTEQPVLYLFCWNSFELAHQICNLPLILQVAIMVISLSFTHSKSRGHGPVPNKAQSPLIRY